MNILKKKFKSSLFPVTIVLISLVVVGQVVYASNIKPGSEDDPIVTLSYLEQKIQQLKYYIDENNTSSNESETDGSIKNSTFEVVELNKGKVLIGEAGTEIILRSGQATAITSALGGLSDVTGAIDLKENEQVPTNHLIIIPRDDNRGIAALENCFVMVKGGYKIN